DIIVKERCFFRSREAYSTRPFRFVNPFFSAFSARLKQNAVVGIYCKYTLQITHDNGGEL
ncbi:hypothetical protein, partial [Idiomarina sp. UBA1919]|uniref:hypothetical protein n=1 Tax=Idiomarina sp. UBA1919 TaxID=1946640 RepID=UPI00257B7F81